MLRTFSAVPGAGFKHGPDTELRNNQHFVCCAGEGGLRCVCAPRCCDFMLRDASLPTSALLRGAAPCERALCASSLAPCETDVELCRRAFSLNRCVIPLYTQSSACTEGSVKTSLSHRQCDA